MSRSTSNPAIIKLIQASVCLAFILSCSKPPTYNKSLGKGSIGDDDGTPGTDTPDGDGGGGVDNDGDGIPDGGVPGADPKVQPLSLDLKRMQPLVFKSLLNKLAFIADADVNKLDTNPAFASILTNRFNLGDYDYARRSPGHLQWEVTQMNLWMTSLVPFCTAASLKTKFNSDIEALVKASLGRAPTKEETDLLDSKKALAADKAKKFEGACLSYLTSLEFRNQWSAAKPASRDYLNTVASNLVQRPLLESEVGPDQTIEQVVSTWVDSPRFLTSSRMFAEQLLRSNGTADGIDYDLPGNLMSVIVKDKKPYSEIITAGDCFDKAGKAIKCDANAPYNAGVLTTRSFLQSHAGPFNISRAYFLLRTFTCLNYPMVATLEPPLKQEDLNEPFSQIDGKGFGGDNGNGTNCLSCHSQFGKHAQFFVKYDMKGLYVADADGLQDPAPNAGSGYTTKLTYTSHLKDKAASESEKSEFFGKPAANLQEAAKVIAADDAFLDCSIRKVLGHYLRMPDANVSSMSKTLINSVKADIKKESANPTFQLIVKKALTNPNVINSYLENQED